MTWFKVDDHFWGHPKRLACSLAHVGLWVTAGSWSAQQQTDGFIPAHVLSVFGGRKRDADALVRAGLWREVDAGWQFHDWNVFQPTKQQLDDKRAEEARRKQEWRDKRANERAMSGDGPSDVPRDSSVAPAPCPVGVPDLSQPTRPEPDPNPTRPDPNPSSPTEKTKGRATTSVEHPDFAEWYAAYPLHKARADAARAYAKAVRKTSADVLLEAARRYAADPSRGFTAHPATWLNGERWTDEGPAGQQQLNPAEERHRRNLALVQHFAAQDSHQPELGA